MRTKANKLLMPFGTHIAVMQWVEQGKYRTVSHRHNGCFRATDESCRRFVDADTIPLLADELLNWPNCGQGYP